MLTALRIPVTGVPRLPASQIKQCSPNLEVVQWVKQWLLGAPLELHARNGVLVSAHIPVHAVDLQQTRVRLVRRLGVSDDVAVLIND